MAQKITGEALETLRSAITPLDTGERRQAYRTGNFPRAELVSDLDRRYRWDLYWEATHLARSRGEATPGDLICEIVGNGILDGHLETALRQVVTAL